MDPMGLSNGVLKRGWKVIYNGEGLYKWENDL